MAQLDRVHPFERAGFGHAPFRCVGHRRAVFKAAPDAPAQPGSSCDYCGTGIMDVYLVRSASGREFKVGSDCVEKVWREFDATIPPDFRAEFARVEYEKRAARAQVVRDRLAVRVAAARVALEAHPVLWTDKPHPNAYYASQGKTLRDYYEWTLASGSQSGMTGICRLVEAISTVEAA